VTEYADVIKPDARPPNQPAEDQRRMIRRRQLLRAKKPATPPASWMRFTIKADHKRFKDIIAHFT
jgi:hypothetical protein